MNKGPVRIRKLTRPEARYNSEEDRDGTRGRKPMHMDPQAHTQRGVRVNARKPSTPVEEDDSPVELEPPGTQQSWKSQKTAKRPYQCPACHGLFRQPAILYQHLAKIHLWKDLLQLPGKAIHAQGSICRSSHWPELSTAGYTSRHSR